MLEQWADALHRSAAHPREVPPELWAELSDPASLARHLSSFGEIRIARIEPEKSVEWEADTIAGTVELKPSGWGTKVTLTVVREPPEAAAVEPEPAPEPEASPEPEAVAEPEPAPEPEASPEPEAVGEPAAKEDLDSQPMTRRSRFLAWLLRPRKWRAAEPEQSPAVEAEPAPPEPAQAEMPPLDLAAELAAELALVEEAMAEQDTALLSAVLDRLGAAHHRPFSRS